VLDIVRDDVNDGRRVGLDKDLPFEGPCFHEVIILEGISDFGSLLYRLATRLYENSAVKTPEIFCSKSA
jgi:hypothetical protein